MKLGEGINLCNNSGGCPGGDLKREREREKKINTCEIL